MCTHTEFIGHDFKPVANYKLTSYSVSPGLDEGLSGPPGENGFDVTFS
jgi:hypothetical protein